MNISLRVLIVVALTALLGLSLTAAAVVDDDPPKPQAEEAPYVYHPRPRRYGVWDQKALREAKKEREAIEASVAEGMERHPVLECIKKHESDGDYNNQTGDGGDSTGAYQFKDDTWRTAVTTGGRPELAEVRPYQADPIDQDWAAIQLADQQGYSPWTAYRKHCVESAPTTKPAPQPTVAASTGEFVVDYARWERLHQCEQPGNWYANGGNPADPYGQVFQGGLGMSTVAWDMGVRAAAARGVTLPDSALDASPEQQMQGAQAFFDRHGWGWSCRV